MRRAFSEASRNELRVPRVPGTSYYLVCLFVGLQNRMYKEGYRIPFSLLPGSDLIYTRNTIPQVVVIVWTSRRPSNAMDPLSGRISSGSQVLLCSCVDGLSAMASRERCWRAPDVCLERYNTSSVTCLLYRTLVVVALRYTKYLYTSIIVVAHPMPFTQCK